MKTTLKDQLESFEKGIIIDSEGNENDCYNFYDWFCRDKALQGKSFRLFKQVKRFVKEFKIDTEKHYVFFKNNCPMRGPLYDDFRICDIEDGNVIWNVTSKSGHSKQAEIWGRRNDFKEVLYTERNLSEVYKRLK